VTQSSRTDLDGDRDYDYNRNISEAKSAEKAIEAKRYCRAGKQPTERLDKGVHR